MPRRLLAGLSAVGSCMLAARCTTGFKGFVSRPRIARYGQTRSLATSQETRLEFHQRCLRPWTQKREEFERRLADLQHPRVRDLAWSVLGPGICSASDEEHGHQVWTDDRMQSLFGDVWPKLRNLDQEPSLLESWLQSHERAGTRLVGLYYESLLHFAFSELATAQVALYSEGVPQQNLDKAGNSMNTTFKPPLKSGRGVDVFCRVHRAILDSGRLRVEYQVMRGTSSDAVPLALEAQLRVQTELRSPSSYSPLAVPANNVVHGAVVFENVPVGTPLFFTYAPGFSELCLAEPRRAQRGEVDFVLWPKASEMRFQHLEVAVKFYLAKQDGVKYWDDFIAPNPVDIFGVKLRHMLNHQLLMGQTSHIRNKLAEAAQTEQQEDVEVKSSLWMNGRLFFHSSQLVDVSRGPLEAWHDKLPILSADLEVGWWCRFSELSGVLSPSLLYLVLRKPFSLCPLRGQGPQHCDHGSLCSREEILAEASRWTKFQYIAVLKFGPAGEMEEVCRGFVVPNSWPQQPKRAGKRSGRGLRGGVRSSSEDGNASG